MLDICTDEQKLVRSYLKHRENSYSCGLYKIQLIPLKSKSESYEIPTFQKKKHGHVESCFIDKHKKYYAEKL